MFAGALALGLEGIVAKDSQSLYVEGLILTWHWQKVKNREYISRERRSSFAHGKLSVECGQGT